MDGDGTGKPVDQPEIIDLIDVPDESDSSHCEEEESSSDSRRSTEGQRQKSLVGASVELNVKIRVISRDASNDEVELSEECQDNFKMEAFVRPSSQSSTATAKAELPLEESADELDQEQRGTSETNEMTNADDKVVQVEIAAPRKSLSRMSFSGRIRKPHKKRRQQNYQFSSSESEADSARSVTQCEEESDSGEAESISSSDLEDLADTKEMHCDSFPHFFKCDNSDPNYQTIPTEKMQCHICYVRESFKPTEVKLFIAHHRRHFESQLFNCPTCGLNFYTLKSCCEHEVKEHQAQSVEFTGTLAPLKNGNENIDSMVTVEGSDEKGHGCNHPGVDDKSLLEGPSQTPPEDRGPTQHDVLGQCDPDGLGQADPEGLGQSEPEGLVQSEPQGIGQSEPQDLGQSIPEGQAQKNVVESRPHVVVPAEPIVVTLTDEDCQDDSKLSNCFVSAAASGSVAVYEEIHGNVRVVPSTSLTEYQGPPVSDKDKTRCFGIEIEHGSCNQYSDDTPVKKQMARLKKDKRKHEKQGPRLQWRRQNCELTDTETGE